MPGTDGETRGVLFHHEGGHALGAQFVVGQSIDAEVVGQRAVGDEALAAVDDVLIPLALGKGEHAADVGTSGGLGQAEGTQVAVPDDGGHEALELLIGGLGEVQAAAVQRGCHGEGHRQGGIHLGDLLNGDGVLQVTQTLAAVLLGVGKADEAHPGEFLVQLYVIDSGFVPFQHLGCHLFLGEFTGHFLDGKLLFVQFEIHDGFVSFLIGKNQLA